jgi:ABC-type glycerol-3-phosphate transport system substrate-binding protein
MKKFIAILTAGLIAASAFAQTVELKVQLNRDTPENKARIAATMDRIKRFQAAYPNITVKGVNIEYDNQGEFFVKQAAGQAPDVLTVWATEASLLSSKKWALPLNSYIDSWAKKDWYDPNSFAPFTIKGTIYGVPENNYVKHVLYNKKLFAAAGVPFPKNDWTWDDFLNAAVKTTDKAKGIAGFAPMGKGGEGGWGFSDFIYQAGGEVETIKDGKAYSSFDSAEALTAAQFLKDLKWKYDVLPAKWDNGWGDVFNIFGAGQAAMVFDGDWGRAIAINNLKMDPKDIGIVPMPKGKGPKGRQAGVLGGTYWIINAGTAKTKAVQDAAWKWIDFERYDDAGLKDVQSQIDDARANKQFRAQFVYTPLKSTSTYAMKEKAILAANPDAAVVWGDDAFLSALTATAHVEPSVEAQKAYDPYLVSVLQGIFSDKNADPAKLLKEQSAKFQKVLDVGNQKL